MLRIRQFVLALSRINTALTFFSSGLSYLCEVQRLLYFPWLPHKWMKPAINIMKLMDFQGAEKAEQRVSTAKSAAFSPI